MDLSFLEKEDVLAEFQDLINLHSVGGAAVAVGTVNINTDAIEIHKLDASSLALTDIISELERRGIKPKGFYSDDSRQLQRIYDDEHEAYADTKRKEIMEERAAEAERAREALKQTLLHNILLQEKDEIANNPRLSEWFRLILSKACPLECRLDINDISARSLSKVIWSDERIVSLDLSNQGLTDVSGCYLARALKNNNTLSKLELNDNLFSSKTTKELAKSLAVNNTLVFLSLASNPLTKINDNDDDGSTSNCVELLGQTLANNTRLSSLSLWQCGIGAEGGKIICNAISNNNKRLVGFEIGYNDFDTSDVILLKKQLDVNRKARNERLAHEAELLLAKEMALQEELKAKEAVEKEAQNLKWLDEKEAKRAETRLIELEQRQREKQKEEELRLQLERAKKLEEERVAASKKKGGTKKGGKGKKKKK